MMCNCYTRVLYSCHCLNASIQHQAENKWDEEGSAAYLKAAGKKSDDAPEELEAMQMGDVTIPADELKAAFPVPWGFLVGQCKRMRHARSAGPPPPTSNPQSVRSRTLCVAASFSRTFTVYCARRTERSPR